MLKKQHSTNTYVKEKKTIYDIKKTDIYVLFVILFFFNNYFAYYYFS